MPQPPNDRVAATPADPDALEAAIARRVLTATAEINAADLVRELGIDEAEARRVLGTGRASLNVLTGLGARFGVSLDWLLCGRGPMFFDREMEP